MRYKYNLFYIISISSCEPLREVKGRGKARQNRQFEMLIRGSSTLTAAKWNLKPPRMPHGAYSAGP